MSPGKRSLSGDTSAEEPAAAGGENPLVHGLHVEQQFRSYSQALPWRLQHLFVFPLLQGQGSGALSAAAASEAQKLLGARLRSVPSGRGATHLCCGLKLSTIDGSVVLMRVTSCPALDTLTDEESHHLVCSIFRFLKENTSFFYYLCTQESNSAWLRKGIRGPRGFLLL